MEEVLRMKAGIGYISINKSNLTKCADYNETRLLNEGFGFENSFITWHDATHGLAKEMADIAYGYWRTKILKFAQIAASKGQTNCNLQDNSLVLNNRSYLEEIGFDVKDDGNQLTFISWETAFTGIALELRTLAEKKSHATKQFLEQNNILSVPISTQNLQKIVKIPEDISINDVQIVLKNKFPNSSLKELTLEGHYVISYV